MTMAKEPAGDDPRPPGDDLETGGIEPEGVDEPDTHTAALQGAAAGGAMSGNAGYAGGLLTGSENGIGVREIPDEAEDADPGNESDPGAELTPPVDPGRELA